MSNGPHLSAPDFQLAASECAYQEGNWALDPPALSSLVV